MTENGYLYLASDAGAEVLRDNHVLQSEEGANIALLEPSEIAARYPFLNLEGVTLGSLGLSGEGWFDSYQLMQAFRRKARSQGAIYREDEVVEVERDGARVTAVKLASGERVACGAFVNTAGASGAAKLARHLGVDIPVHAKKRCVFVFEAKEHFRRLPARHRHQWRLFPPRRAHLCRRLFAARIRRPRLRRFRGDLAAVRGRAVALDRRRVPAFENLKLSRAWAGHYDLNMFDHNAIVGRLPGYQNAYLAAGFSGHGVQQSPAVGRGLSELIVHGGYRTLDLADFAYERSPRTSRCSSGM